MARPSPRTAWDASQSVDHTVEIYAPDRERSDLLVEYATPLFRPEIVPGLVWIVRMQPPAGGPDWVLELLALVERWLHAVKLPWVNVVYDGRSYLIRAHSRTARAEVAT